MHDNELKFSVNDFLEIDFKEIEHKITDGKDFGSVTMDGTTLTIEADRKGSEDVAYAFRDYIGGEAFCKQRCTACMSNDDFPNKLNFAVNGTFTVTTSDGKKFSNTVAIAQGHNAKDRNNWWIGGKHMHGKAVGTPTAVGIFNRCDIDNTMEEKADEAINNIAQAVSAAILDIFESIAATIDTDPEGFAAKIGAKIDVAAEKICELIDKATIFDHAKAKKFVNDLAAKLKELISQLADKTDAIETFVKGLGETIADKIEALITDTASAANKTLHEVIYKVISAVSLLFVRIDGSRTSPNVFTLSNVGIHIIDKLK